MSSERKLKISSMKSPLSIFVHHTSKPMPFHVKGNLIIIDTINSITHCVATGYIGEYLRLYIHGTMYTHILP